MKRRWVSLFGALGLGSTACQARDVAVFDLPASAGGESGTASDAAGSATAGFAGEASSGAAAGGAPTTPPLGAAGSEPIGPATGGGGMLGMGGGDAKPCRGNEDCGGWLCERSGCEATTGYCAPPTVICLPDPTPVCGCDGITYWNDCIRQQTGVPLAGPGECGAAARDCETGGDCGVPGASCSHLVAFGDMCGRSRGSCWVLPPECLPSADRRHWQECGLPGPPGAPTAPCQTTCEAIASERPAAPPPRRGGIGCN